MILVLLPLLAALARAQAVEYSPQQGLKVSAAAEHTLGIATAPAGTSVPVSALVYRQDEVGVYRLRDGRYRLIAVRVLSKAKGVARVQSRELAAGDRVVVAGAALLRAAELQALEPGE